jgi:hypothetical protein
LLIVGTMSVSRKTERERERERVMKKKNLRKHSKESENVEEYGACVVVDATKNIECGVREKEKKKQARNLRTLASVGYAFNSRLMDSFAINLLKREISAVSIKNQFRSKEREREIEGLKKSKSVQPFEILINAYMGKKS